MGNQFIYSLTLASSPSETKTKSLCKPLKKNLNQEILATGITHQLGFFLDYEYAGEHLIQPAP